MNGHTDLSDNGPTTIPAAEIPVSWVKSKLGELLPLNYGKGLVKKKRVQSGEVPVYGSSGIVGFHDKHIANGPALIVGRKGTVGKVYLSKVPSWPIDTTYFVEATPSVCPMFFGYLLGFLELGSLDKSTAIPGLSRSDYNEVEVYVPPFAEQRRIVAEIEKQFTRLDAAEAALGRVRANLKRYRASVLKAACEGKLVPTEAELAEAEGRDYEHAEQLLERILAERRARWESQGKLSGKYKELAAPDTRDLPDLPDGWVWTSLSSVGEVRLGRQRSPKRATGPNMRPYLRAANVTWDGLNLSDVKEMDFNPREFEIYRLMPGDILLNEASGSPDEVGKPAVWRDQIEGCCFQNTLIRVRAFPGIVPFLFYHLLSDARSGNLGRAARGVGIHHLGAQRTASWTVALPPLEEQRRIVAEIEQSLSVIQQAETAVEVNLKRVGLLRQSILKQAFCGRLVPQDPNDEPASVLLERIKAEGEAARSTRASHPRSTRRRSRK